MGKHEPMTAKAIANKIKAKGLQKIKYYCQMCNKQCRDDNGFKCHIMSESHQRQALIVGENPEQFVSEFSSQFMEGFMFILKTRYRTKRILANTVFQEYIKERDHVHMNGTRWTSLTEFAYWLGEHGYVQCDESERGVLVTYIDKDPETLKRQELEAKRAQQAKEAAERSQKEIERQIEASKKVYEEIDKAKKEIDLAPVPIVKIAIDKQELPQTKSCSGQEIDIPTASSDVATCSKVSETPAREEDTREVTVVERPVFQVQGFSLKTAAPSAYKPPPPKRKVIRGSDSSKKAKIA